jgi:hypothetical protein
MKVLVLKVGRGQRFFLRKYQKDVMLFDLSHPNQGTHNSVQQQKSHFANEEYRTTRVQKVIQMI